MSLESASGATRLSPRGCTIATVVTPLEPETSQLQTWLQSTMNSILLFQTGNRHQGPVVNIVAAQTPSQFEFLHGTWREQLHERPDMKRDCQHIDASDKPPSLLESFLYRSSLRPNSSSLDLHVVLALDVLDTLTTTCSRFLHSDAPLYLRTFDVQ